MRNVFGVCNTALFDDAPEGTVTWYLTRKARDAALERMRDTAIACELSESRALSGIRPVRKPVRGDASRAWLDELMARGSMYVGRAFHVWGDEP